MKVSAVATLALATLLGTAAAAETAMLRGTDVSSSLNCGCIYWVRSRSGVDGAVDRPRRGARRTSGGAWNPEDLHLDAVPRALAFKPFHAPTKILIHAPSRSITPSNQQARQLQAADPALAAPAPAAGEAEKIAVAAVPAEATPEGADKTVVAPVAAAGPETDKTNCNPHVRGGWCDGLVWLLMRD